MSVASECKGTSPRFPSWPDRSSPLSTPRSSSTLPSIPLTRQSSRPWSRRDSWSDSWMARRIFGSSSSSEPSARLRPSPLSGASGIKIPHVQDNEGNSPPAIWYYSLNCIFFCQTVFNVVHTCVVTPPAGLWGVAAASKAVQTQHVSSAAWPVPATVLLHQNKFGYWEQLIKAALQVWLLSFNNPKPFLCFTKPEFVWCNIRRSRLAPNKALEPNNEVLSGVETFPSVINTTSFVC